MTHRADWSLKLKIAVGVVGVTCSTVALRVPHTGATEDSYIRSHTESESNRDSRINERRSIEADRCEATDEHGHHDDSHRDDDRSRSGPGRGPGERDVDHGRDDDARHRHGPIPQPSPDGILLQDLTVDVRATDLLKVDRRGRVIAAATNTGCVPRRGDDVFLIRPDGSAVQTAEFDFNSCRWLGNFRTPGVFQPQSCNSEHRTHG